MKGLTIEPARKSAQPLRTIDLCSGAGGWACAARGLPIEIVLAVDLWPVACRTYALNHPQTEVLCGDLRQEATRKRILQVAAGGVDLILGGIPCQWLSVYRNLGRNKVKVGELQTERLTLDTVLEMVRCIDPPWWCLEDVTQLARELPILTPFCRIDAKGYSAQRRKRLYVGNFPVPAPGRNGELLKDRLRPGPWRIGPRAADRQPVRSKTFSPDKSLAALLGAKSPTICNLSSRRDAEMVIVDPGLPGGKRQMEWQEAAVLQGFPRDYLFYGSPSDVSLQIANAMQIDLGRTILKGICRQARRRGRL